MKINKDYYLYIFEWCGYNSKQCECKLKQTIQTFLTLNTIMWVLLNLQCLAYSLYLNILPTPAFYIAFIFLVLSISSYFIYGSTNSKPWYQYIYHVYNISLITGTTFYVYAIISYMNDTLVACSLIRFMFSEDEIYILVLMVSVMFFFHLIFSYQIYKHYILVRKEHPCLINEPVECKFLDSENDCFL